MLVFIGESLFHQPYFEPIHKLNFNSGRHATLTRKRYLYSTSDMTGMADFVLRLKEGCGRYPALSSQSPSLGIWYLYYPRISRIRSHVC
jgi:hypothetical protein